MASVISAIQTQLVTDIETTSIVKCRIGASTMHGEYPDAELFVGGGEIDENITLLITGKSREAATGCYCPESVLLRRLLKHMIVERDEVVVLDMEAGIEHLTRGTSESMDGFIVGVEPGKRSIQTAHTVQRMAGELGIKDVLVVANKVRGDEDIEYIKSNIGKSSPLWLKSQ